jgi:hypothetical protein
VTAGRVDAATVLQNKPIVAMVNVTARFIFPVYVKSGARLKRRFLRWRFGKQNGHNASRVKDWELIAGNLTERGWSWGCVSAPDSH